MLFRLFLICVAAALAASGVAQDTTQTAELIMVFRDSRTGTSVVPDSLTVDGREVAGRVDAAGRITTKVPAGSRDVIIKARNYNEMSTRQVAHVEDNPTNEILLDPSVEPIDLQPENLEKLQDANGGLIIGYVVDYETGIALENTQVKLTNDEGRTVTNERGFFALRVPMTAAGPMPESKTGQLFTKKNFEITKSGFKTEDRRNVVVLSGEAKFIGVKLNRGSGTELINEDEHRNDLQRSIFNPSAPSHDDATSGSELTDSHKEDNHTSHAH